MSFVYVAAYSRVAALDGRHRHKSFAATREYLRSLTGSDFATEDEW
jgi:hypothetical protein